MSQTRRNMRNTKLWMNILWVLVAVYAVAEFANTVFSLSIPLALLLLVLVAFSLVHGAIRYRWSGIATFIVICLVVSNILENTSILTGFPFGHYHYTGGSALTTFAVPFIAAFFMVVWDLCLDPGASTVRHTWIWEQGGGYF